MTADEVLLGEVLALRTILMNLLFSIGKGAPTTPEHGSRRSGILPVGFVFNRRLLHNREVTHGI